MPGLRVTEISVSVDIFPAEQRVSLRGTYDLENKSGIPLNAVELNLDQEPIVNKLELSRPNRRTIDDWVT